MKNMAPTFLIQALMEYFCKFGVDFVCFCFGFDCFGSSSSSTKNAGKYSDSSFVASSMASARPTYDSEPASGKAAVFTGAFAIRKSKSIFFGPSSGNS